MNSREAIQLLREKMDQHGLQNWGTRFLREGTYRCYGLCNYQRRDISLNREFCEKASYEEVLDLCLHEISHGLAFVRTGRSQKHNHIWKSICREIGADPTRCYEGDVKVEGNRAKKQIKYILRHKETLRVYKNYYRKPKWGIGEIGRLALVGKPETKGKLEIVPFRG